MKRRSTLEPPALSAHVTAYLLQGFGGRPPEGTPPHQGEDNFIRLFIERDAAFADLWRTHEVRLRVVAAEWGVEPEYGMGRDLFYAEWCAHLLTLSDGRRRADW